MILENLIYLAGSLGPLHLRNDVSRQLPCSVSENNWWHELYARYIIRTFPYVRCNYVHWTVSRSDKFFLDLQPKGTRSIFLLLAENQNGRASRTAPELLPEPAAPPRSLSAGGASTISTSFHFCLIAYRDLSPAVVAPGQTVHQRSCIQFTVNRKSPEVKLVEKELSMYWLEQQWTGHRSKWHWLQLLFGEFGLCSSI